SICLPRCDPDHLLSFPTRRSSALSFYLQHGEYILAKPGEPPLSARMRERLALLVVQRIGERHAGGGAPLSVEDLTREVAVPGYAVRQLLDLLTEKRILVPTRSEPCTWVPVRDLAGTTAWDVVEAVRSEGEEHSIDPAQLVLPAPLARLVQEHDHALAGLLGRASLASLLRPAAVAGASSTANAESPVVVPPESGGEEVLPEPAVTDNPVR